jgi:hypothetical protein
LNELATITNTSSLGVIARSGQWIIDGGRAAAAVPWSAYMSIEMSK